MKAITIILASALITAGAIKAAPALAETPAAATNVSVVRTADLDLRSSEGQRRLDHRLARAARQVCGAASDVDIEGKNDVRKCRDDVLARARDKRDAVVASADRDAVIALIATR